MAEVNKDLQNERSKCSFDIKELTNIIDGGPEKTLKRKEREKRMYSRNHEFKGDVPDDYLSNKELYENSVRKSVVAFGIIRQMQEEDNSTMDDFREVFATLLSSSILRDGSPLVLHYVMFMPAIMSQGSEEQQMEWMPRVWNCSIIGSYAQTELGHGTFIRGLETTATYDPTTKEFVLNTPSLSSYKWWPGGLGHTANYCIVVAQLYTKGECHGIHSFIVQVRDEETHMPLPGIKVGEIGVKLALNAVNNGFLGFNNVRIPRKQMLMKHAQVLEDGTYVRSRSSKLNYGAMVFVRVVIVFDSVNYLSKAVTIATRYSAVRRQSQIKESEPEVQILDYLTQQHKIFIGIAACHAQKVTAQKLWDTFNDTTKALDDGNLDKLPELHALACCLKAISTSDGASYVESCRLACGGHGYMNSSNLPVQYGMVSASCTYEGENTVLLLQTARFLVKTWQNVDFQILTPTDAYLNTAQHIPNKWRNAQMRRRFLVKTWQNMDAEALTPTVAYLKTAQQNKNKWENTVEGIIQGLEIVAMRNLASCVEAIRKRVQSGMCYEDAWNMTSIKLVAAAEAHCRVIIISTFYEETKKAAAKASPSLKPVLYLMVELYAVYWALKKLNDLLQYTRITSSDVDRLQCWYEELLTQMRPNAVGLVDAFDFSDDMLCSTLGAYDGRVYERLMEGAMKSPLNAEPVNESFHKYLKPFMQGKL